MAVTSWRTRHQHIRSGKIRQSKHRHEEVLVDLNDDPADNIKEVLKNLSKFESSDGTIVNYLNVFVKIVLKIEGQFEKFGYHVQDILGCLRLTLFNLSSKIRAGSLRCIRHVLRNEGDVIVLNKLLIPYLITRSLDCLYKQDSERLEAMKLMRKILILSPLNFDSSMARSLVALANEGSESKDRMLRSCLATLSELGVLNPKLFIQCGGVAAITRNLLECQTPKIAEALCGVLLLMLDRPETRDSANVDLHTLAAPFCDFHYKLCLKENKKNERELRLNCSRLSLLTVLRSWSGILHFCGPKDHSGFKAVVDVLYLDQLEVRKAVLDLLYELLGLPQPEWSDELSVALGAIDPCEPQASWRLAEGFVAAEGKSVLPHLSKTTPSLTEMHLSLLLYCFLQNGLVDALTEVIATSDTFISVRATVLLGELLRLIQVLLPPDCCNVSPALPLLIDYAIKNVPQAIGAITALQQLHKLMKRRPASFSIYLDYIIKSSSNPTTQPHRSSKSGSRQRLASLKSKIHQLQVVLRDSQHNVKDTGVLISTDPFTWNWDLVGILLRGENNFSFDLTDSTHRAFIKRLVEFFMPSKNKYSHLDLQSLQQSNEYTQCGVQLVQVLTDLQDKDIEILLFELFRDILNNITAITSGKSVHDCLFSPQHMINTQCQSYFLLIGRFATTKTGLDMLTTLDVFTKLEQLATSTNHDVYVKLIVSCLDYSTQGPTRKILKSILTCDQENSRIYATQFLLVLLRAGAKQFSSWGIELLVNQLKDKSKAVYFTALNTLHEACELPECLESLISLNPNFDIENERDMLLWIRFMSTKTGFNQLNKENKVLPLLKHWDTYYIYRYVKLTEVYLADALTLHQRGLDGKYDKRTSSIKTTSQKNVFLPPHIYGQMNQQKEALQVLLEHGSSNAMIKTIMDGECSTDDEIIKLKAAIWSMGHLTTSNAGFTEVNARGVIDAIIELAQSCPVYSIRATSFYSLGLVATTKLGADHLFQKGWVCTRHHRHDCWPIIEDEIESIAKSLQRKHNNSSMSEEGSVSMENAFTCEFESIDEDTGDDSFSIAESPVRFSEIRRSGITKQSTLPAGRRPPNIFHKRSYSESKTFDMNGYSEERSRSYLGRLRNNSESTTSGVSSCDSLQGMKNATIAEHMQTLSPIPSSSSLTTLQMSMVNQRSHRTSECSHRISSQSDTNSEMSSNYSNLASNKLTYQDLVGYTTLRLLRTSPNIDEDWPIDPAQKLIPNYPLQGSPSLLEDFKMMDISLNKSVFSVQKFPLSSFPNKNEDKIYLGIALPQILCDLFPQQVPPVLNQLVEESASSLNEENSIQSTGSQNSKYYNRLMTHTPEKCFYCSSKIGTGVMNLNDKKDAYDVLHNVERLSNPLWNKHVRQYMLQYRQKNSPILKDVCIYSEVCKMLSENTYRVLSRRILHELFLELNSNLLHEDYQNLLAEKHVPPTSLPISSSPPAPSICTSPTLDSLHLIYKENKFPIRESK